ncbi:hypothetical protein NI17_005750 [Thermobifida halotolerans]|uniref:DUF6286 domain-containing protein n=1 Tax=Thermobifida halotolerans TaxID=483545 RepID=A0AA97LZ85_9ACTN|nr:DUF6286 domain-containing protein [Thermobifida halotolerans]UOE20706.1 hypothetical protein NI17_005750 [Thermobifida halotolerans]
MTLDRPPSPNASPAASVREPAPGPTDAGASAVPDLRPHRSRRLWSRRDIPAALVALAVLAACTALLYGAAAVWAGAATGNWLLGLTEELTTRPLGDPWVLAGAAVAAAVGVWLLVIALTPGLRNWLPLAAPGDAPNPTDAYLDRAGAALLLRDALMRVPGVGRVRVRVGRRRVRARVDVRFRDPREVRGEVTDVLREQVDALGPARTPRIAVRTRRLR